MTVPEAGIRGVLLSFGGYRSAGHPIHGTIAALSAGDEIEVRPGQDGWELQGGNGTVVGQLARSFDGIAGLRCNHGRVPVVVSRAGDRAEPEFQKGLPYDSWEVVVP